MDVERVIEELNKTKMTGFLTIANTGNAELDSAYKMLGDSIDLAIQTIRELQEQNKWHYCNDEFPKESGHYLVTYHEWSDGNFLPKYDNTRVRTMHFQNSKQYVGWNYPVCCDERAEKDTYREVIAWMELPKFEEVE